MSALQLQILLEHVTNKAFRDVEFSFHHEDAYRTLNRLHIWFTDEGGNRFHRSFGADGRFIEAEV